MTAEDLAKIEKCLLGPCRLCGGFVGPDSTLRPMCYQCAPQAAYCVDFDWARDLLVMARQELESRTAKKDARALYEQWKPPGT